MGSNSHSRRGDRKAILRDVYEDNVRATRPGSPPRANLRPAQTEPTPPPQTTGPHLRAAGITTLLLAIVLVLGSALTARHQEHTGEASSSTTDSGDLSPAASSGAEALGAAMAAPTLMEARPVGKASAFEPPPVSQRPPSVADLYGLHVETIVIDAGHGGIDPGAIGSQGLYEKDVTLDVARRLKARLEQYPGYRILLTRDGERSMDLRERIEFANTNEADLFISLHVNWLPVDSIAPIKTYYYGPNSDARALRLAQRENRNSGYTLAEFNDLTRRLSVDLKIQESREAAHAIQEGLVNGLRHMGRDISDWGTKSGDFMVLLGVEAPSILAEIGSLSNREEESKLRTVSYREKLAYILAEGITNYLKLHEHPLTQNGSKEDTEGV